MNIERANFVTGNFKKRIENLEEHPIVRKK